MRILHVLPAALLCRIPTKIKSSIIRTDECCCRGLCLIRYTGRIGTEICDESVLIKLLGHKHCLRQGKIECLRGLLLHGRCSKGQRCLAALLCILNSINSEFSSIYISDDRIQLIPGINIRAFAILIIV